jgi:HlyD family secretion protein
MIGRSSTTWVLAVAGLLLAACADRSDNNFQGWVEADLVFVSADEAGRIENLAVREGDPVAPRALLFALDDELQKADVAVQEVALKNAEQDFKRAQQLLKTNSGTQKAYEDAEAAVRTAQARLNSAQTRLARRRVFSPVAGTVEQVYYRAGEIVPATRPVVALLPPANVKLRFFVGEPMLPGFKLGDTVKITCDGCAGELTAKVSFIARSAEFTPPVIYSMEERSKLVFLIEARPETPERLRVGQPVSVTLPARDGTP